MTTTNPPRKGKVKLIYDILLETYGRRNWWPAETPFEVCVGAILTQSTSWINVEKAIDNLKVEGLLNPDGIASIRKDRLARLIKPSLYYNVKARKLKEFTNFLLNEYGGEIGNMNNELTHTIRKQLLAVWGLGPETVDSILLYAVCRESFVVDAYTRRVFTRVGLIGRETSYDDIKGFFEQNLTKGVYLYNEYHALIVEHGKNTCKIKPLCEGCCLKAVCAHKI